MLNLKKVWLSKSHSRLGIAIAALTLVISGCGTENDLADSSATATVTLAKVTDIPQVSADNYDNNVNGLITGNTLNSWLDNWSANKPSGVTGKLVILQTGAGPAGFEYIKPNGTDVFTYSVGSSEWVETRSNGVTETVSMVPSGRSMDTFLAKYNIDPAKDMILCAMGTGGGSPAMRMGRCWYMFRYWGTAKENLAILNGGNDWLGTGTNTSMDATDFSATASTPPLNGSASVKDLPEANMALQATLEDMMNIVPAQDTNLLNDGVFIWDARGNGTPGTNTNEYSPDDDTDHRNGGATQGHPNGALMLTYTNMLNTTEGYTYKSKAEIQSYLDGNADGNGNAFAGADLQPVGQGAAYQTGDVIYTYCETTFRAMVTGTVTAVIMGLPTRFYDGAMTEWHSMANVVASDGNAILPWDSPWRTDKTSISMFRVSGDAASISPRNINNAYATSANKVIQDDMAYKGLTVSTSSTSTTTTTSGSSGGGGVLPANPCGG